jgi:LmbE family N-acetylglucosaminyl deacetylase
MTPLRLGQPGERLSVLCLGAHSDDIEIGAGATILQWIASGVELTVDWCVLSAAGARRQEAERSAADFLKGAASANVHIGEAKDGYFPYYGAEIKDRIESLKSLATPDVIFTHRIDDAHQDHREVSKLTCNAFRDHLILEYEIPKWDGDLGQPNAYMPVTETALNRKIELLNQHFGTQRSKDWFDADTFRGLARLRGVECRAPERFAEAFDMRKIRLG